MFSSLISIQVTLAFIAKTILFLLRCSVTCLINQVTVHVCFHSVPLAYLLFLVAVIDVHICISFVLIKCLLKREETNK